MIWIKQLFRKRKFRFMVLLLGLFGGSFYLFSQFAYLFILNVDTSNNLINLSSLHQKQNVAINKIMSKWKDSKHSKLVKDKDGNVVSLRGIHDRDIGKYLPNVRGKFACLASKEEIDFLKINDDYCDCPKDGSDEPGTNACNNGGFYCERHSKNSLVKIASFKVNDGVCDCCDGSDEWNGDKSLEKSANKRLQATCPNRC